MQDLYPSFNISNKVMTIQTLNSIFERLKKICSIWKKAFRKEETSLTKFSSDNGHKLKEKQNHNPLFDCQAWYKSAKTLKILKSLLSLFTNFSNKYKVQAKSSGLFYIMKLLTKRAAKSTRQLLQKKSKKYLIFLTWNCMYHERKYWIANGGACFERQLTFFHRQFRIMGAGLLYDIMI